MRQSGNHTGPKKAKLKYHVLLTYLFCGPTYLADSSHVIVKIKYLKTFRTWTKTVQVFELELAGFTF